MKFLDKISLYHLIVIFLVSLYFLGAFKFGLAKVLGQALPPILAAITSDAILRFFRLKKWTISLSALISGLIIGLVAQFGEKTLVLISIAVAAIIVKFLVRLDGRHVFNPAATGLFIGLLLLSSWPSWWVGGTNTWIFAIWIPILLYKQRRWAPMVGFLVPVIIFNGLTILSSVSLLFFMSVMLIEPKTSPTGVQIGLVYGLIVGLGYLLLSQTAYDSLIASLLIGNLGARLLPKIIV